MKRIYDHKDDGTAMAVSEKPDGSFYMENGDWDAEAKDQKELIEKLGRWGYNTNYIGWEK